MNTLAFILGIVIAVVVIQVVATAILILKMKQVKKLENDLQTIERSLSGSINEVSRNMLDNIDEDHRIIEDKSKLFQTQIDEVYRNIDDVKRETLSEAKSYADSRFDKTKKQ